MSYLIGFAVGGGVAICAMIVGDRLKGQTKP